MLHALLATLDIICHVSGKIKVCNFQPNLGNDMMILYALKLSISKKERKKEMHVLTFIM